MHHHGHHHGTATILKWSFFATIVFVAVEAFAGFHSESLALVSDAGHNFTDALALVLATIGVYMQAKPADSIKTFGYHRAGVLTAFANALTLVVIAIFIFYEAWDRFLSSAAHRRVDYVLGGGGRSGAQRRHYVGPASR